MYLPSLNVASKAIKLEIEDDEEKLMKNVLDSAELGDSCQTRKQTSENISNRQKSREEIRQTHFLTSITRQATCGSFSSKYGRRLYTEHSRDGNRPITVDIPYHTAITQPPIKRSRSLKFDALGKSMAPLPHLFDSYHRSRYQSKTDVSDWLKQVKKEVPRRPKFVVSANLNKSFKLPYFIIDDTFVKNPSGAFQRATGTGFDKEFVVNPEWISEKLHLHGHKAYRTCGIRYGWCF